MHRCTEVHAAAHGRVPAVVSVMEGTLELLEALAGPATAHAPAFEEGMLGM